MRKQGGHSPGNQAKVNEFEGKKEEGQGKVKEF